MPVEAISKLAPILLAIALAHFASDASAHDDEHRDAAYGRPGDPAKASRTVAIDMSDAMRFTPAVIRARKGETIRFALSNSGKLRHEMVLGSSRELKEHAALMRKFPEMQHADPNRPERRSREDRGAGLAIHPRRKLRLRMLATRSFRSRHARQDYRQVSDRRGPAFAAAEPIRRDLCGSVRRLQQIVDQRTQRSRISMQRIDQAFDPRCAARHRAPARRANDICRAALLSVRGFSGLPRAIAGSEASMRPSLSVIRTRAQRSAGKRRENSASSITFIAASRRRMRGSASLGNSISSAPTWPNTSAAATG